MKHYQRYTIRFLKLIEGRNQVMISTENWKDLRNCWVRVGKLRDWKLFVLKLRKIGLGNWERESSVLGGRGKVVILVSKFWWEWDIDLWGGWRVKWARDWQSLVVLGSVNEDLHMYTITPAHIPILLHHKTLLGHLNSLSSSLIKSVESIDLQTRLLDHPTLSALPSTTLIYRQMESRIKKNSLFSFGLFGTLQSND